MDELQIRLPINSIQEITRLFVPENTPEGSILELTVEIQTDKLSLRELGNYFSIIDRFYGRLYEDGIYAYGHREEEHLKISEIRKGSIEAVITEIISSVTSPPKLVIVFLLLKYLPNIIKSSAEAVKNLTSAYKDLEEASSIREERENRKRLREAIKKDDSLQELDSNRAERLVKLLDSLYSTEVRKLPRAIKTAKKKVKNIRLKVVKNKNAT